MASKITLLIIGFCLAILWLAPSRVASAADDQQTEPYDVIIVGGGIAGMTAAYYLRDLDIKVLEMRSTVGGRAFSGTYKGFTYAKGTEYLGKPEGPIKEIISALGLTPRQIPYPADVYYHRGEFYPGEMGRALLISRRIGLPAFNRFVRQVARVYRDYEDVPDFDPDSKLARLDDITAREWFEEMAFSPFLAALYNVTFKGLFGATIDEISALSALTEIAFDYEDAEPLSEEDLQEFIANPQSGRYPTQMYAFDRGIARIPLAIADALGSKVQVNSRVTRIERLRPEKEDEPYHVTYRDKSGGVFSLAADTVIIATPAAIAAWLAPSILSPEQKELLSQIEYAPYVTVALFGSEPIFNQGFDLAAPEGMFFTDVYDATWIERHYNKALSGKKAYVTTVYVAPKSYRDRSILNYSDSEILERLLRELAIIFPDVRDKVDAYEVIRFKYAYPVMTPGAYKRLTRLHRITTGGLYLAGDYMIYPTFEAAATSGMLAAEKVRDWLEED